MADTVWKITPEQAGKYILSTADTYVDRNIEFDLAQASLAVSGEAEAAISSVSVGLRSQNQYSISGEGSLSGTATANVTEAGYISEGATGAISGDAILSAKIPAAVLEVTGGEASANLTSVAIGDRNNSKYPITGSGSISGTFGAHASTEGYIRQESATGNISGSVLLNAEIPAIMLQSSGTASASLNSVAVGSKSGSSYPITGSASITGTTVGSVKEAGYGTNESANGSVSGTASLSATLPAITLSASGSGSATIDAVSVAADSISGKFKVSGSKAISGSASASITTAGYGKNETGSGSVSGTATVNALISAAVLDNKAATGVSYAENTSVVIPSQGALYISEGYIPATYITLDQMLDGKADTAGTAESDLRTGKVAYTVDGEKITGNMGNATITGGAISHTLGAPAYNSTSGKFDQSCSITTAVPSVNSAGYISSSEGTKNASTSVSENHALNKITGSIAISGTKTVKPVISKQSISISGVTDAADAAATTTAPSSGVYVKVNSAAASTNVSAAATISAEGYGTNANHGIAGSGNVAVGASASDDTYIKIKEGSAKVNNNTSLSITAGNPTLNSSTGKYDISLSTSGTVSGSVSTEGWIKSVASGSVSGSGTKSLNAAALTHNNTATETRVGVSVSGTRSSNLAAPGSDTTYYITINGSQTAAGSVSHGASVSEGYVPSAGLSQNAIITTNANISGNGNKVYLKSTSITNSLNSAISSGYTLSLLDAAPSVPYITLTSNASAISGAVYNGTSAGVNKYMKVYAGEYTIVPDMPTKGQIITMNLDGTDRQYRVLKTDGNVAEVIAMFDATTRIAFNANASCFLAGTKITMADGSTKNVEDLTYDDELKVWDFDTGEYGTAPICWLTKDGLTNDHYYKLTFSDGTELCTTGTNSNHKLYNVDERFFKGVDKTEIGDRIFSENGIITVVNKEYIEEEIPYYNVITSKKFDCFANGILTADRYGNMYSIDENMTWIKDDREIRPYSEFKAVGISEYWYDNFRLGEQTETLESSVNYIVKCQSQMKPLLKEDEI